MNYYRDSVRRRINKRWLILAELIETLFIYLLGGIAFFGITAVGYLFVILMMSL